MIILFVYEMAVTSFCDVMSVFKMVARMYTVLPLTYCYKSATLFYAQFIKPTTLLISVFKK